MGLFDIEIESETINPDEDYDHPNGSKWIVAVDEHGCVSVLKRPNIHHSFFDNGSSAEDIGLPFEVENKPGVYEWICNMYTSTDWETGFVDDYGFDVEEEKCLYSLPE